MKTQKKRHLKTMFFFFLVTACLLVLACSPEDGRDGRDGLNGINGTDGQNGMPGEQGEPGEDGNANVQASDWLPIQFDYVELSLEFARMYIEIPDTQQFIDNGGVAMMFLKQQFPNSNDFAITPLPYGTGELYLYYVFGDHSEMYGFEGFVFYASWIGMDITELESGNYTLRYVLIPGSAGKSSNIFSKMSYEEIITHLDLDSKNL